MNVASMLTWGFIATILFTAVIAAGQGFGYSRISMTYLLGTMFTSDGDRARVFGFFVNFASGWTWAAIYAVVLEQLGHTNSWIGALLGLLHGLFVLLVILPMLPAMHPRMASERHGPTPTRQLQPPGFMGLNYGRGTPLVTLVAHIGYGALFAGFYSLL